MKTVIDTSEEMYKVLKVNEVLSQLNGGGIWRGKIPEGYQDKINIAINTLTFDARQLQTGLINVNIHCPDIVGAFNGQNFTGQADFVNLNKIVKIVLPLIESATPYEIQSSIVMEEKEKSQHYINIRVIVRSPNLK